MTEIADENMFAGFDSQAAIIAFCFLEGGIEALDEILLACLGKPSKEMDRLLRADQWFMDVHSGNSESSRENLLEIANELSIMGLEEASRRTFTAAGKARPASALRSTEGDYCEPE